jgi:hypothetical protein
VPEIELRKAQPVQAPQSTALDFSPLSTKLQGIANTLTQQAQAKALNASTSAGQTVQAAENDATRKARAQTQLQIRQLRSEGREEEALELEKSMPTFQLANRDDTGLVKGRYAEAFNRGATATLSTEISTELSRNIITLRDKYLHDPNRNPDQFIVDATSMLQSAERGMADAGVQGAAFTALAQEGLQKLIQSSALDITQTQHNINHAKAVAKAERAMRDTRSTLFSEALVEIRNAADPVAAAYETLPQKTKVAEALAESLADSGLLDQSLANEQNDDFASVASFGVFDRFQKDGNALAAIDFRRNHLNLGGMFKDPKNLKLLSEKMDEAAGAGFSQRLEKYIEFGLEDEPLTPNIYSTDIEETIETLRRDFAIYKGSFTAAQAGKIGELMATAEEVHKRLVAFRSMTPSEISDMAARPDKARKGAKKYGDDIEGPDGIWAQMEAASNTAVAANTPKSLNLFGTSALPKLNSTGKPLVLLDGDIRKNWDEGELPAGHEDYVKGRIADGATEDQALADLADVLDYAQLRQRIDLTTAATSARLREVKGAAVEAVYSTKQEEEMRLEVTSGVTGAGATDQSRARFARRVATYSRVMEDLNPANPRSWQITMDSEEGSTGHFIRMADTMGGLSRTSSGLFVDMYGLGARSINVAGENPGVTAAFNEARTDWETSNLALLDGGDAEKGNKILEQVWRGFFNSQDEELPSEKRAELATDAMEDFLAPIKAAHKKIDSEGVRVKPFTAAINVVVPKSVRSDLVDPVSGFTREYGGNLIGAPDARNLQIMNVGEQMVLIDASKPEGNPDRIVKWSVPPGKNQMPLDTYYSKMTGKPLPDGLELLPPAPNGRVGWVMTKPLDHFVEGGLSAFTKARVGAAKASFDAEKISPSVGMDHAIENLENRLRELGIPETAIEREVEKRLGAEEAAKRRRAAADIRRTDVRAKRQFPPPPLPTSTGPRKPRKPRKNKPK